MSSHAHSVLWMSAVISALWLALGHLYHGCILSVPRERLTRVVVCVLDLENALYQGK